MIKGQCVICLMLVVDLIIIVIKQNVTVIYVYYTNNVPIHCTLFVFRWMDCFHIIHHVIVTSSFVLSISK